MNSIYRLSILSALMLCIAFGSTPAQAWITCSGCQIRDAFTIPGSSADSSGGSYTIQGSSAYSVSGDSAYAVAGNAYAYCNRTYDPRYCYWQYYAPRNYVPDDSGADYYVTGGPVYR